MKNQTYRRSRKKNNADEQTFAEEVTTPLTDRDRDRFLNLLANPPAPNKALKKAAARHKARRG